MNIDWDKKGKYETDPEIESGSYESMLKVREREMPKFQKAIEDALKHFTGQPFAVLIMSEDENGLPSGCHVVLGGAGRPKTQIALAKELDEASTTCVKALAHATAKSGNIDQLKEAIESLMGDL